MPEQHARTAVEREFAVSETSEAWMEISLELRRSFPSTIPPASPFYVSPRPSPPPFNRRDWQYLTWSFGWKMELQDRASDGMEWLKDEEYARGDFFMDPRE